MSLAYACAQMLGFRLAQSRSSAGRGSAANRGRSSNPR